MSTVQVTSMWPETPTSTTSTQLEFMLCVEKNYTRRTNAPSSSLDDFSQQEVMLRSGALDFNYKLQCLFCKKEVNHESNNKHPDGHPSFSEVRTLHVVDTIRSLAGKRDDEWGRSVALRLGSVIRVLPLHLSWNSRTFKDLWSNLLRTMILLLTMSLFSRFCCFNDQCMCNT